MEAPKPPLDSFEDSIEPPEHASPGGHAGTLGHQAPALVRLSADLRAARLSVSEERGPGRHLTEWTPAQANLLAALEAYAEALASAGHPLPYRIRDELFMRRRLAGLGRGLPR